MKAALLVMLELVAPAVAQAQEAPASGEPGYAYPRFVHTLAGMGGAPSLPANDRGANVVLTEEIGFHPLSGALGTGLSLSSTQDVYQHWSVVTPGLLAQLDLTYLCLTALYSYPVPQRRFVRVEVGGRLGLAISQSERVDVSYSAPYTLIRPELQPFLDIDVPLPPGGGASPAHYSLLVRGALDEPVNLSGVFRWSVSVGLNYGWGQP